MTTAASPALDQRHAALQKANRIRSARAAILTEIRSLPAREGVAVVTDIIRRPPDDLAGMPLERLTRAIHHFGATKARALLFTVTDGRVWMNPAIGELSFEQRQKAYDLLDRHCTTGKKAA